MGLFYRLKTWWMTATPEEKVMTILGATATVGSLAVTANCISNMDRVREDLKDIHLEVNLIPAETKYYDQLVRIWKDLEPVHDAHYGEDEHLDSGLTYLLQLIEDAAVLEGRKEEYENSDIPCQLYD